VVGLGLRALPRPGRRGRLCSARAVTGALHAARPKVGPGCASGARFQDAEPGTVRSSAAFCALRWARRGSVLSTRPDGELLEVVTLRCAPRARAEQARTCLLL
jgi:hypothetical protein